MKLQVKNKHCLIKCDPLAISITPYMLAKISDDFHNSAESYKQKHFSLAKYSMYLSSIERGLKAAILSKECTKSKKRFLAISIKHNLEKVIKEFELLFINIFSKKDKKNLKNVNKLYFKKGFDYFSDEMLLEMMYGYKKMPKLEVIEKISQKVNQFIIDNNYFKN
ncbi:MAG TPA: hypothetical protein PLB52_00345 [Candidatus Moranbacteria bacterium]|nr:hypothetical protein [Candidatus Moranbacteria bacterium]